MKSCTPLWREAHLEVKCVKKLGGSDHFWKLRCRKSARRGGAKRISKTKCTKHTIVVHAVVARSTFRSEKVYKTPQRRTTFGS